MGKLLLVCAVLAACSSSKRDVADGGPDAPNECKQPGMHRCTGSSYEICTDGLWVTETDCLQGCIETLGCVACTPNERFCKDGNVWLCDETGEPGEIVETCTGVNTCEGGGCVDACANAATNKSYIGCEYWAVDLDNAVEVWGRATQADCTAQFSGTSVTMDVCFKAMGPNVTTAGACDPATTVGGPLTCPIGFACGPQTLVCISDAQHSPFAIVVSNPQTKDVNVTVTGPGGQTMVRTVAAGQVASIVPQAGGAMPDQSVDGTVQGRRAYRITSDLPIVAYQFNPLDNVNVFSNDASLLIPRTSFDIDYYGMSHRTLERRSPAPGKDNYYGYLTVVAWQDNTQISVTPTTAVQSSTTQATIAAGATASFTLDAFEVLQLQA
ncbi:MAG: IgGFc-binding protein, partial [Deltaproteobacteria bacterium]|nr:IgGFc-binding protein [Deltaproteobacteria bacterium]